MVQIVFHKEWVKTFYLVHFKLQLPKGNLFCNENKIVKEMYLCEYTYTYIKLILKFKTYGQQNIEQSLNYAK